MSSLLSAMNLQKVATINGERIYTILTNDLELPSQIACEVFKTVVSNYKTVQTMLKKQTVTNPRSQGGPRFQSGEELANSVGKQT